MLVMEPALRGFYAAVLDEAGRVLMKTRLPLLLAVLLVATLFATPSDARPITERV